MMGFTAVTGPLQCTCSIELCEREGENHDIAMDQYRDSAPAPQGTFVKCCISSHENWYQYVSPFPPTPCDHTRLNDSEHWAQSSNGMTLGASVCKTITGKTRYDCQWP